MRTKQGLIPYDQVVGQGQYVGYALEQLEADFYTQVTKTPYANMASADTAILSGIRDHEIAHRDFFKAALKKNAIPALEVDFTKIDFNSRDSVLTTAKTFEDLGVASATEPTSWSYAILQVAWPASSQRRASSVKSPNVRDRVAQPPSHW